MFMVRVPQEIKLQSYIASLFYRDSAIILLASGSVVLVQGQECHGWREVNRGECD